MEPGDQVFLSYEDYNKLIQADKQNKGLTQEVKDLKKINQDLTHQIQVSKQKLILKNGIICKEQFKTEYLMSLFDDINKSFGIKAQDIGKGLKFLKSMDQTYFSVLKLPSEVDENEKLPDNFSKSNVYMEVDTELEAYKNLAQVCAKQWNEKLKLIEYLEASVKTAQNKDVKKIEEQSERMEKQLRAQIEELKCEKMQLRVEIDYIQSNYQQLQALNTSMQRKLQQTSLFSSTKQQQLKMDIQNLQMRLDHESLKNSENQKKLKETIQVLEEREKELKHMAAALQEMERQNIEKLRMMQKKQTDQLSMHEGEKVQLKAEARSLHSEIEDLRRFAQISSEKIESLKNQVQIQQNEILSLRKSTPSNDHVTDIKYKLFSLISEYIIYLNKSLVQMNLTAAEKKTIIKSEVMEVEEQFGKELKKLQF